MLAPYETYELVGDVPNVIFPCAVLRRKGTVIKKIAVGAPVDTDFKWLKSFTASEEIDFGHGTSALLPWETFSGSSSVKKMTFGKNTQPLRSGEIEGSDARNILRAAVGLDQPAD